MQLNYTANWCRPLRRRLLKTRLPPGVDSLAINPWRRCRRRFLGCQVRLDTACSFRLAESNLTRYQTGSILFLEARCQTSPPADQAVPGLSQTMQIK